MSGYYILDDEHNVVGPVALQAYFEWCRTGFKTKRRVNETTVGDVWVSTVFLGLDHRFGDLDSAPIVFETMTNDGEGHWGNQERYTTWKDAEAGHARMVAKIEAEANNAT